MFDTVLNKTSRYLKIDFKKFLKGWSWLFSSQVIGACAALLLAYGYANYLPQDAYGTYKYILSVISILTIFSLHGMGDASQRSVAKGMEAAFWQTFTKRLKWSLFAVVGSIGVGIYYVINGNFILGTSFLIASPFLLFLETFGHYGTLFLGRKLFKELSYNTIFLRIISTLFIFIAVFITNNVVFVILTYLASIVLLRGLIFFYTVKKFKPNKIEDSEAIRYGAHMSMVGVVSIITSQVAPILLWHFLGAIELAIYAFAMAVVTQMRGMFKLVTTKMAFPKFSSIDIDSLKKTLPSKVIRAHAITLPLSFLLALLIPYVYQLLFPNYIASVPYAQALVLLFSLSPLRFFSTALMAKGSAKSIHISNLLNSGSFILFLIVTIPIYGIWGIVYANIAHLLLSSAVSIFLFRRI